MIQSVKKYCIRILALILVIAFSCTNEKLPVLETGSQKPMPLEWIDKDTGFKVMRLSRRQGSNRSFYFHNNPFVPASNSEDEKMIFYGSVGEIMQLFSMKQANLRSFTGRMPG